MDVGSGWEVESPLFARVFSDDDAPKRGMAAPRLDDVFRAGLLLLAGSDEGDGDGCTLLMRELYF